MDFTGIVSAVAATAIVAGLTSVAAVKIVPGFTKWGYNKVIGWFR